MFHLLCGVTRFQSD